MTAPTAAHAERASLCSLLIDVGPDAPTLCEGWSTADLAAHLVVREHNVLAAPGILLPGPFARFTERTQARTKAAHRYEDLVGRIRSGPPALWRPFDAAANLSEYYVHHEDVRRGAGDTTPRGAEETAEVEDALWRSLQRSAGLLTRRLRATGLDLVRDSGTVIHARKGDALATLSGRPGEIILYLMGRKRASHAVVAGPPAAAEALQSAPFGI